MIDKVFIDIDGVVADFVSAVIALHGTSPESVIPYMRGSYDIQAHLGISAKKFWGAISEEPTFWEELDKTKEADQILETIRRRAGTNIEIFFLSAPSLSPLSHYGKAAWIKKHYPEYLSKLILTGHKYLLATRNSVLVDDSDAKIDAFRKAGGKAILFPRPWNSLHQFSEIPMSLFTKEVNRVF
jgi:5'(3')-deoxyribonucleotidase